MLLPAPNIDERTADKIVEEIRTLAPFYTPEWDAQEKQGAGFALLQNFAQLLFDVAQHLNLTPAKNFVEFLDRFGIKLQPPRSARVPVTFLLAPGTPQNVLIPARTQAAAEATDTRPEVVFETEQNLLATIATLQAVYSVQPSDDTVYEHLSGLKNPASSKLFAGKNLQEHILYLGHKEFLMIRGVAKVYLKITSPDAVTIQNLKDTNLVAWEYSLGKDEEMMQEQWYSFTAVSVEDNNIILTKGIANQINPIPINQIENRWIRCRAKGALSATSLLKNITIDTVQLSVESSNPLIDLAFYNDVPLDLTSPFFPFGTQPRPFDTFYIASKEAFSKKSADITLTFNLMEDSIGTSPTPQNPEVIWEYWNGTGWVNLRLSKDELKSFLTDSRTPVNKIIEFTCPKDIAATSVNGQENSWIRARIVGGSYGTFKVDGGEVKPGFKFPKVNSLNISYQSQTEAFEKCITYSNLNYQDQTQNAQTAGTPFIQPFLPPEEDKPTFYLGFDKPLVSGPIGVYFSLVKQEYLEETKPRLQWQYWNGSTWFLLDVLDDTDNLTRSGILQLVCPADFAAREKFGKSLFWIRAVDVEDRFRPPSLPSPLVLSGIPGISRLLRFARLAEFPLFGTPEILRGLRLSGFSAKFSGLAAFRVSSGIPSDSLTGNRSEPSSILTTHSEKPCPELLELIHPKFSVPAVLSQFPPLPILQGIFLNTVWAIQAETVRDEILGSSDGRADQSYTLIRNPVVSEEIWVNEINTITDEERKKLYEQDPKQIQEVRDEKGNLIQVWVRWRSAEDFLDSTSNSRDYVVDRVFGTVQFGDGTRGMIPPIGVDNIKANYQFGGGAQGNVEAGTVISLKTSVAGVDKVINHEPAGGGADTEVLAKTLERGPQVIKHRNRAIAREDFEWIARQASNSIAKVKCLPTTNQNGEFETGWVAVIIVPQTREAQPLPSAELIRQVERYLADRCPNVVSAAGKLIVTGPAYVEVSVTAEVFTTSIDLISQVQSGTIKSLKKFLHPLTGGLEGEGWDFGRLVCLSDIIAMLEDLSNVDHVDNVTMQLRDTLTNTTRTITGDVLLSASLPPYAMIFSGEHDIRVKFKAQP